MHKYHINTNTIFFTTSEILISIVNFENKVFKIHNKVLTISINISHYKVALSCPQGKLSYSKQPCKK